MGGDSHRLVTERRNPIFRIVSSLVLSLKTHPEIQTQIQTQIQTHVGGDSHRAPHREEESPHSLFRIASILNASSLELSLSRLTQISPSSCNAQWMVRKMECENTKHSCDRQMSQLVTSAGGADRHLEAFSVGRDWENVENQDWSNLCHSLSIFVNLCHSLSIFVNLCNFLSQPPAGLPLMSHRNCASRKV